MSESRSRKKTHQTKTPPQVEEQNILVFGSGTKLSFPVRSDRLCGAPNARVKADSIWASIENKTSVCMTKAFARFVSHHFSGHVFCYYFKSETSVLMLQSLVSARCRMISWFCMSRSTTACWSASLKRSSLAYWPEGSRRKLRGNFHSSLVTRKWAKSHNNYLF